MRGRRSGFRKVHGFTLIELLVVIAIISVLAAILMPALRGALESARSVMCMSQMKQFYLATVNYTEDWNGEFLNQKGVNPEKSWLNTMMPYMPEALIFVSNGTYYGGGWRYGELPAGALNYGRMNDGIILCPSHGGTSGGGMRSYDYNVFVGYDERPNARYITPSHSHTRKPFLHSRVGRRILLVEGQDQPYMTTAQRLALDGRHSGRVNTAYGDGQVRSHVPYWLYGSGGSLGAEGEPIWKTHWWPCYDQSH